MFSPCSAKRRASDKDLPVQDQDQSVPAELANNQNNQNQDQDQDNGFIKSKSNEKKDKKTKRAEEKKRAREREAKKAAANDYIPGMEGSVRPADEVVANDENDEDNQQRHYVRFFFAVELHKNVVIKVFKIVTR